MKRSIEQEGWQKREGEETYTKIDDETLKILQEAINEAYKKIEPPKEQTKTQRIKLEKKAIERAYQRKYKNNLKHIKIRYEKGKYRSNILVVEDPITKVYCETRIV